MGEMFVRFAKKTAERTQTEILLGNLEGDTRSLKRLIESLKGIKTPAEDTEEIIRLLEKAIVDRKVAAEEASEQLAAEKKEKQKPKVEDPALAATRLHDEAVKLEEKIQQQVNGKVDGEDPPEAA